MRYADLPVGEWESFPSGEWEDELVAYNIKRNRDGTLTAEVAVNIYTDDDGVTFQATGRRIRLRPDHKASDA